MAENQFGSELLAAVITFWEKDATQTNKNELQEVCKNNGWKMRREVWDNLAFKGNLHAKLF